MLHQSARGSDRRRRAASFAGRLSGHKLLSLFVSLTLVLGFTPTAGFADSESEKSNDSASSQTEPVNDEDASESDGDASNSTILLQANSSNALTGKTSDKTVTTEDGSVLYYSKDNTYNGWEICGSKSLTADLTIPATINGSKVVSIGSGAFASYAELDSVALPEGLLSIGNKAFQASGFDAVVIPSTVTLIGASAFSDNENLGVIFFDGNPRNLSSSRIVGSNVLLVGSLNASNVRSYAKQNRNPYILGTLDDYAAESIAPQTYTGSEIEPVPTLENSIGDVFPTDYLVTVYEDNINVGTATWSAISSAVGGHASGSFAIQQAPLSDCTIQDIPDQFYTGSAIEPNPVITYNGTALVKDTDYTLSYADNVNVGEGTVTIQGIGNFDGSVSQEFHIVNAEKSDIADAYIAPIPDQPYSALGPNHSTPVEPEISVQMNGNDLVQGTDYTVEYANNNAPGIATATITGIHSYTGERTVRFGILREDTYDAELTEGNYETVFLGSDASYSYKTLKFEVPEQCVVSFSYYRLISYPKTYVSISLENQYGSKQYLPEAPNTSSATAMNYWPVFLPAGTYYVHVSNLGKRENYCGVRYDVLDEYESLQDAGAYEFEDNSEPSKATFVDDSNGGFVGAHYDPLYDFEGNLLMQSEDTDYFAFESDGSPQLTEVYLISGYSDAEFAITDETGATLKRGLQSDGANLSTKVVKSSSNNSTYRYEIDCGALPQGTYYIKVTGKNGHSYIGSVAHRIGGFIDVATQTPHYQDIEWMSLQEISEGWTEYDGTRTYHPMETVKRQDMAAFLHRLAVKVGYPGAADYTPTAADKAYFSDVDESTPHAEDIWWLASTGIARGWTEADGSHTYRGMDSVKRQDMAAFLARLAKADVDDEAENPADSTLYEAGNGNAAAVTDAHYGSVSWLYEQGVSTGYRNKNGTVSFGGETETYRQDMAAFLHRMSDKGLVYTG